MLCLRFAGVQGARNYSAGFHRVLDSVLSGQRHLGLLSVVSRPLVRRHGHCHAGRLVGLRLVDGESHCLHALQQSPSI